MPFESESRSEIRDKALGYLQARFNAIGKVVSVLRDSFSYRVFDVVALIAEGMQKFGITLPDQILPDRATGSFLLRHATVDGVVRKTASAALIQVLVSGTNNAVITFGNASLQASTGQKYRPVNAAGTSITSCTLNASGNTIVHLKCTTLGTLGTLKTGVILQWVSKPTNVNSTAVVAVVYLMRLTGTPSAVITFGSSKLRSATYVTYTAVDVNGAAVTGVTLDGSGNADVYFKADTSGVDAVVGTSAIFSWDSTPTNLNSTATVTSGYGSIAGADEETETAWRGRVLARRKDRPGGGNRADFKDWAEQVINIAEAYIYSNFFDNAGDTPYPYPLYGTVTIAILGKAPSPAFTGSTDRVLALADAARVNGYIEGSNDTAGNAVTADKQVQLRPTGMNANDYKAIIPVSILQDVDVTVTLSGVGVPSWYASTFTVGTGCTTTLLANLSTNPITLGVVRGDWIGVRNTSIRGWYQYVRVESTTSSSITLAADTPLYVAPPNGTTIRPASSVSAQIRDAILGVFHQLGPSTPTGTVRWPAETTIGPSTLFRFSILAPIRGLGGLTGVSGVINATLTTPAADVTLTANHIQLIVPREIIIRVLSA